MLRDVHADPPLVYSRHSWSSGRTPQLPHLRQDWTPHLPHLRWDSAHRFHICAGTGLTPPTTAPGLGSPLPHLCRDWAHPCHICAGTGLAPPTSAPGLGSPLPHLRRDWAHPSHICAGTGLAPPTSAPGLGSPLPHLHRDLSQAQQDLLRFKRDLERAHDEQAHALQAPPHAPTGPQSA
jgi:hypothetical protein